MEKIFVTRPSVPDIEEYIGEIRDLWDNKWLTNMGPKHNLLEQRLGEYLEVENCSLFANGHTALETVLQAFELTGEVITTPFTFVSTTHAIVRSGLTPVFCDISPTDYTIDVSKIEELITEKTSAIVPVHVYGNICNIEEIEFLANKYHLKVIYDAAHAFGVRYKGKSVAGFGDASMFSFHSTKVFNTIEGGAVCCNDKELCEKLFQMRDFGIEDEETVNYVSGNAKMNEFQAAMGICNLRHISDEIQKRRKIVELYHLGMQDLDGITLCHQSGDVTSNYAYLPIVVDETRFGCDRDELKSKLQEKGIYSRKYFYPLTCDFKCYREVFGKYANVPNARRVSERVLTLPLYADLALEDVKRIIEIVRDCEQ